MTINRPQAGHTYYAPIALASRWPLVFGENHGVVVDQASQTEAVVYSTREAADAALADTAIWGPGNAAHARVAALTYRGDLKRGRSGFAFATPDEMHAHDQAATAHENRRAGATIATRTGVVIAQTTHHTLTY